jgi:pimeloyl-ACP methyl ester carboxylesterase
MSLNSTEFVVPRPGGAPSPVKIPISGPTEEAFTNTFGKLLPPAKYLNAANGKAAYYEILPSSPGNGSQIPDRVLLVHGIQTPALGMFPLANALHALFPSTHFVLVDLWGHGLTDTPIVPHEQSLFHQLLDDLLDHLKWPSVHIVGFSFGGALTVGYVASRSSRVKSFVLVAPAGLIRSSNLLAEDLEHLRGDDFVAARKWVIEYLEGGDLIVPANWKERFAKGEVVATAVKEWQLREHPGHAASVVAILRDAGAMDNDAEFVNAVRTGIPSRVILGELDGICTEKELTDIGFTDVVVVPQIGHEVARAKVPEVAAFISDFWKKLSKPSSG